MRRTLETSKTSIRSSTAPAGDLTGSPHERRLALEELSARDAAAIVDSVPE